MPKRVFVSAWVGAGNLGDELLFARLVEKLRRFGVDDIVTASLAPSETEERFGVRAIPHRDVIGARREIRRSELFVLGPGGILHDTTSRWNLPYQLHRAALARRAEVPIVGVGLGAGPFCHRSSGFLLRRVLGSSGPLAVRDQASAVLLHEMGLPQAIATADLVVSTPTPEVSVGNDIVVSLRPHRPKGSWLPVSLQRQDVDGAAVIEMANGLDAMARSFDAACRFVAFDPGRDHELHEQVANHMSSPTTLVVPDFDSVLGEVGSARAVVAMRFHSAIAALVSGRPAVLVGYAPKVDSLADRVGGAFTHIPAEAAAFTDLPTRMAEALAAEADGLTTARAELRALEAENDGILAAALG